MNKRSNRSPGIYMLVNLVSGKHYVGQTNNLHLRCLGHFASLARGDHSNGYLQKSFAKHGAVRFVFFIAERCAIAALTEREQFWMDSIPKARLYNLAPVAGCCRGVVHSKETLAKRSLTLKGRVQPPQVRAAVAAGNAVRVISDVTRAKLSAALSRRVITDATRAKLSLANKGRPISAAHKAKLSEFRSLKITGLGRTLTQKQWSIETGIPLTTISKRLDYGWTPERAVTTPRRRFAQTLEPES